MAIIRSILVTLLLATVACAAPARAAAEPAQDRAQATVAIFIDRSAVVRDSRAGKSIQSQVEALAARMEADYRPENEQLQRDIAALQTEASEMAPDARQQRIKDLETRRQALQKKVEDRQAAIQNGVADARAAMERALGPILERIMTDMGANMLLDRGLVVLGATSLDVTSTVLERLDSALPTVTVTPRP